MAGKSFLKTNNTPWMDEIVLIGNVEIRDSSGFSRTTPSARTVDCNFSDGVARGEFYESMKAGMRASATVELWADDYRQETLAEYGGVRYEVLRHYPSGYGTIFLILSEVIR